MKHGMPPVAEAKRPGNHCRDAGGWCSTGVLGAMLTRSPDR